MSGADQLRRHMRAVRRALSMEQQKAAEKAVFDRIAGLEAYAKARCVMAYMASGGEVSLAPAISDLLERGCTLVLPRCEEPGVMTARRVGAMSDLQTGAYGLLEPKRACPAVDPARIDVVLVPGTAFDREGGRIGQGGGYYDRFLPKTQALRVGICHGFALTDTVPSGRHDQRMDVIITPYETIDNTESRRMHG